MTKKMPSMKDFLEVADGVSVHFQLEMKRIKHEFVGRYMWSVNEPNEQTISGDFSRWEGFETLAECVQDFITFRKKEMKGTVK